MSNDQLPVTFAELHSLPPLDVSPSSPTSPPATTTDLPHSASQAAFREHLTAGLSPRSSPSSAPPLPPLRSGTGLLASLGRPFLSALVQRHRPVVWLHAAEPCLPCTPDWFARHADLHWADVRVAAAEELSGGLLGDAAALEERRMKAVAQQQLEQYGNGDGSAVTAADPRLLAPTGSSGRRPPRPSKAARHQQYNLRMRPAHRGGQPAASLSQSVPMLCYVRDAGGYYELLYVFCYPYNAPYRVLAVMWLGAHDGDWEHVTMRVDKRSDAVTHVYYGAHGWRDGVWRAAGEFETDSGRPVVYVARGSHATYPHAGRWLRIWCGANDLCERGWRWDAERTLLLHFSASGGEAEDAEIGWLRYSGWWEHEGINTPHQQQWWYQEPTTSNTVLRRCFTSFVPPCLGMQPEEWLLKRHPELEDDTANHDEVT